MQDKEFDDRIKYALSKYPSAVPADMWDRITAKKKRRRFGFLLFLLPGILLVGAGAMYYFTQNGDTARKRNLLNENDAIKPSVNTDRTQLPNDNAIAPAEIKTNLQETAAGTLSSNKKIKTANTRNKKKKARTASAHPSSLQTDAGAANIAVATSPNDKISDSTKISTPATEDHKTVKPGSTSTQEITPTEAADEKFALELFVSPQAPFNHISADDKTYQQALQSAGSMQLSYTAGARISYAITKKLFVKIGAQYSQLNEKIDYKDSQGNSFQSMNHYKTVSVPLLISYRIITTENFRLHATTGTVLNIVSRYQGIIPSAFGQPIDLQTHDVYNKNVSASFYLSVDISRKMNRRNDLFIEPWFSYRLKNMVNSNYSFDQRIHSMGLSLGWRYRLFRNNDHQF